MNKVTKSILFIIMFLVSYSTFATINMSICANAESTSIIPQVKTYEFSGSNNYEFSNAEEVETMTFGQKTLGTFSISGDVTDTSTYRNQTAYGVNGSLSFSYDYDGSLQSGTKKKWNLHSDSGNKIDDFTISGSIKKGA